MNSTDILDVITKMAKDDNKGLQMTTTLTNVRFVDQGAIVSFGTTKEIGSDVNAGLVTGGIVGDYIAVAFFISRKELQKYK